MVDVLVDGVVVVVVMDDDVAEGTLERKASSFCSLLSVRTIWWAYTLSPPEGDTVHFVTT